MPRNHPRDVSRRLIVVWLGAALALSSCAAPSGELPRAPAVPRLEGASGVVLAAASSPAELFAYDLGTEERAAFRLPPDAQEILSAYWLEQEAALVAVRQQRGDRLYRVTSGGRPEQLAGPIRATRYDVGGSKVLASSCRLIGGRPDPSPGRFEASGPDRQTGRVHVLDLAGERTWVQVATGCVAALSPDGSRVVHSPDGTTVWITDLDGPTREVLDVRDLNIRSVSGKAYTIKGPVDWSEGGIAVAIEADGSDTIVRLSAEGDLRRLTPLNPQARDFFVGLAWSPDGSHLAIPAYTYLGYVNPTGSVALSQNGAEDHRVLSLHPYASSVAVWAPDGRSLLLGGDTSEPWVVTDLEGRWLERVGSQDALPLDWRAS